MLRGTGQLATNPLQKFDFMLKAYQYIDYMSTSIEVTYDFIACIDFFKQRVVTSITYCVCWSVRKKFKNVLYISFWAKENLFLKGLYEALFDQLLLKLIHLKK